MYILKSISKQTYYIGHTKNVDVRLTRHNRGYVRSTKYGRPWEIVHIELCATKKKAFQREMQIKSYKGGVAFKKLAGISTPS